MASKAKKIHMNNKTGKSKQVTLGKLNTNLKKGPRLTQESEAESDDSLTGDSEEEMEQNFQLISKKEHIKAPEWESDSNGETDSEEDEEDEQNLKSEDSDEEDSSDEQVGSGGNDRVDEEDNTNNVKNKAESDDVSEVDDDSDSESDVSDDTPGFSDSKRTDGSNQTHEDIKKELSTMSFEELMKLQNKVGTKVYNEVVYGAKNKPVAEKKKIKRQNKNRPMEVSAKKPVPFLRSVVPVKKRTSRDPRFDDLSGEYKPDIFYKTYGFLDDIKRREKEVVQKKLKHAKVPEQKEQLQHLLQRMVNQERAQKSMQKQREKELEFKRQQRELVNQGQKPFFLKKSDKRKLELAEKYSELKKSDKLENFLSKKRKRNATKDRRKMPFQKSAY